MALKEKITAAWDRIVHGATSGLTRADSIMYPVAAIVVSNSAVLKGLEELAARNDFFQTHPTSASLLYHGTSIALAAADIVAATVIHDQVDQARRREQEPWYQMFVAPPPSRAKHIQYARPFLLGAMSAVFLWWAGKAVMNIQNVARQQRDDQNHIGAYVRSDNTCRSKKIGGTERKSLGCYDLSFSVQPDAGKSFRFYPLADPLDSFVIREYSERPSTGGGNAHTGIDLTTRNVYAALDGRVAKIENSCIMIMSESKDKKKDTPTEAIMIAYCCTTPLVKEGDNVDARDLIGKTTASCKEQPAPPGASGMRYVHVEAQHGEAGKPATYEPFNLLKPIGK